MEKLDFGIKGLIIKNGKFLAVHKAGISDEKYELPGGRMEFGETIEDTLIREMKEELNLNITPIKIIGTWNYMNDSLTHQVAGVIYFCKTENLDFLLLSEEHTDYKWFEFGDAKMINRLFSQQIQNVDWEYLASIG